jgi:hypothetical protein
MVLYLVNLSLRLPLTWQQQNEKKNVKVQPKALSQNLKNDSQTMKSWLFLKLFIHILGYESKWSKGEILFSTRCIEGHFLCAS